MGEVLLGVFVEVRDSNAGRENGVVWVFGREVGSSLRRKILQEALSGSCSEHMH